MKTASATKARMAIYDHAIRAALPRIQSARAVGVKNAAQIAEYLDANGVFAPTNACWTVDAVLRCLRRLKSLGLDMGSLPPQCARAYGGPRSRSKSPAEVLAAIEASDRLHQNPRSTIAQRDVPIVAGRHRGACSSSSAEGQPKRLMLRYLSCPVL